MLPLAEAAELIAAEVLSALPIDLEEQEEEGCDEADAVWRRDGAEEPDAPEATANTRPMRPAAHGFGSLEPLLVGLEDADAFALDDRLRRALSMEQRLDARIGPLLSLVWNRWVKAAILVPLVSCDPLGRSWSIGWPGRDR